MTAWTGGHQHRLTRRGGVACRCGARGGASGGRRWLGHGINGEAPMEKGSDGGSVDQCLPVVADGSGRLVALTRSPRRCQLDQMEAGGIGRQQGALTLRTVAQCSLRKMPPAVGSAAQRRHPLSDDGGTRTGGDKLRESATGRRRCGGDAAQRGFVGHSAPTTAHGGSPRRVRW
jgi:hypothetical protein